MLDAGEIDLCWICGLPYVEKADRGEGIELCVAPVMKADRYERSPVYYSDVMVRSDSAYARFADLQGADWGYNEPRSHSGFNLVCYHLSLLGYTLGYFGRLVEAGSHQAALRLIVSGEVAAAAIDSTVLEAELAQSPGLAAEIRRVAILGPSPAPPWVISTKLPALLRDRIRRCLAGMSSDAAGRRILESWQISELRGVDDAAYDPIRVMASSAQSALPVRATARG